MKRILITASIISLFFSCSNDNNSESQDFQNENFYALTVGNSWVYKNYLYNPNTQTHEETGVIDSISIVGTQEFEGETYFKFRRFTTGNETGITLCNPNGEHFEYLRESEGNLIWETGQIKFTNNDYTERILDDNPSISYREILIEGETELTVEAGTFDCINSERYVIVNGEIAPARDKFYYADGFGLIYDTSSFASQETPSVIRRLESYDVQ